MDKKVTYNAVSRLPVPSYASQQLRALDILISKNGVFRTNERWVYDALSELIKLGYINVDSNVITIGSNFERVLISLCSADVDYAPMLINYRQMVTSIADKYNISDSEIMDSLNGYMGTDEKIIYLASVLNDIVGKVDLIIDRVNTLEALCSEIDLSLSVVESVTLDENSDS